MELVRPDHDLLICARYRRGRSLILSALENSTYCPGDAKPPVSEVVQANAGVPKNGFLIDGLHPDISVGSGSSALRDVHLRHLLHLHDHRAPHRDWASSLLGARALRLLRELAKLHVQLVGLRFRWCQLALHSPDTLAGKLLVGPPLHLLYIYHRARSHECGHKCLRGVGNAEHPTLQRSLASGEGTNEGNHCYPPSRNLSSHRCGRLWHDHDAGTQRLFG
mmetsp:Transcript_96309/g.201224  ORF Transcript_96309/g.201224 Transcript_96309/m.201224 type:complete len:221 (+) Transcript_96309:1180-1842(+)